MKTLLVYLSLLIPVTSIAQQWRFTGSMGHERFVFQMVPLQTGKVLAIGGWDQNLNAESSCELYDPATESWSATGSLHIGRAEARAIRLPDGRVVLLGGETGSAYSYPQQTTQVEIYDPSTGSWSLAGSLQVARQNTAAALLHDGTVLMIDGLVGVSGTTSCEIYDPLTETSHLVASTAVARNYHDAITLLDGKVLVSGGRDGGAGSNYFNVAEIYDPATDSWTATGAMAQARVKGVIAQFSDSIVIVAGGRNSANSSAPGSEILDGSGSWGSTSPLHKPCTWSANVLLPHNRLLMTGGAVDGDWFSSTGTENILTSTCEWYDKYTATWFYAPQMNKTRQKHEIAYLWQTASTELPNEFVIVAGGLVNVGPDSSSTQTAVTPTCEILDIGERALETYMAHQPTSGVSAVRGTDGATLQMIGGIQSVASASIRLIHASTITLEIVAFDGKVVESYESVTESKSILVPMDGLKNGAYLARMRSASGETAVTKFIVQN
jgi:hypothetical protein